MTILLRVLLNSNNTQIIINLYLFYECSLGNLAKKYKTNNMHNIYFYADKQYPLMNRLVHGKEKYINVS